MLPLLISWFVRWANGPTSTSSLRPWGVGKLKWKVEDIERSAAHVYRFIPEATDRAIMSGKTAGSNLVSLRNLQPGVADLITNYMWLRPLCELYPSGLSSQYEVADILLFLDSVYYRGFLLPGTTFEEKSPKAVSEAGTVKKLMSHLRYLWRNSTNSR
jgi:hypothetical protein